MFSVRGVITGGGRRRLPEVVYHNECPCVHQCWSSHHWAKLRLHLHKGPTFLAPQNLVSCGTEKDEII